MAKFGDNTNTEVVPIRTVHVYHAVYDASSGATYAAAVVIFERDFLTTIVPLIRLAYGAFGAPSLRYMFGPFAVLGLATFVLVGAQWRFLRDAPFDDYGSGPRSRFGGRAGS